MSLQKITFYYQIDNKRKQKTYKLINKSIDYITSLYDGIESLKLNSYKVKLVSDNVTSIIKFTKRIGV